MKDLIAKVAGGAALSQEESASAFGLLTSGEATAAQIGAFLMALRVRGETDAEITGAARALRSKMIRVEAPPDAVDVVGTGGDDSGSYNISTCAALIVAGAGVPVAKHGNRALSSRCGAADVLSALGVRIGVDAATVERCVREAGIGFMFAPSHHPALSHVGQARRQLGTRTIFNLLGPLINPAGVRSHLVGVYSPRWVEPVARVLGELGSIRAYVVHSSDGLDEITGTGPTLVAELAGGAVRTFEIMPEDVGLPRAPAGALKGGDATENSVALREVLSGKPGPYRDASVLNAGAALVVAGRARSLRDGVALAATSVDSGEAAGRLDRLIVVSNA
jgi:anthranilate phosphoribosyltransferase